MPNDGQIVFEVTADGKHAIADIKEITRAIQKETKNWDDATEQSTTNMSNNFSSMLKKLVAGFSAVKIGKALLDIGKDAVEAASALQEVQNVVDVTFGDAGAAKIETWARNAGEQFGLTETQAKQFTSTLGAMMKSAGMTGDEIVDMSTDLAGLAADMASFYNLDFDTAFQKIRSGISGETEPLKQLGINMSVANLNAFALQQGLEKTFEKMTQGEQTMLRYQYLMSATADAQGDFARTSDGYANSMRKFETNVNAIKTALGQTFLDVVGEAVNGLNSFLELLLPDESKRTVLDDFADIDLKTGAKLQEIEKVRSEADDLTEILGGIFNATDDNGENAGDVVAKLGVKSEETAAYLANLGLSTDEIDQKESKWLETCKRLVKVIPGLSEIINTETGEVKGGTQAVKDYIDAWEKGQKKLVLLGALEQKESALSTRFADLPGLELDMALAEKKVRDQRKKLDQLREELGIGGEGYEMVIRTNATGGQGILTENEKAWNDEIVAYGKLQKAAKDAGDAYNLQKDALEEAKVAIEEYRAAIEEEYGSIEAATEAGVEWSEEMQEAARTVTEVAKSALQDLTDYVEGVRTATMKSIDSTVKGFEKIETPMQKARQKVADLTDEMGNLDKTSKDYESELKKINDQINATNVEKISAQSMGKNLEQQAQFMEDYLANLQKARELGVSEDILAQLSDGSVESYDYLEALAQAAPGEVQTINENFQKVIDKKNQLADELTGQQLAVDQTYQSLQEKAAEAVAALDMAESAQENAGKTISGMAQGIADHVPEVQSAVDSIIEQLNRLDGWGISIDLGGFGNINFTTSTGADASGRFGIGYVPRDDYLIRAHEGERLLTAQENQIWNALLNGGVAGFDLEDLGGVMRDNIRPGGNVYLDGSQVGRVISEQQGRSYKSLQRSGWQG